MRISAFRFCPLAAALVASLLAPVVACAQRSSGSSSGNSYSGGRSSGSRLPFSQQGANQNGAYGSNSGASGGYGGNTGAFGAGGQTGFGGTRAGSAFGQQGQGMGQGGPGGIGQQGGQAFERDGFVGRDAEDVRGMFDNLSGRDRRGMMFDMMIENLNEMRESRRRWRESRTTPPPVKVRLVPAFDLPVPAPAVGGEVQTRLSEMIGARTGGSAQVEVTSGIVVLRGSVGTPRERALLEKLASLEPGVSAVQNLLTVPAASAPTEAVAP